MDQRSHPAMTFWVVLFLVFVASCATQDELRKAKGEQSLENLVEVQPATPAESVKQKEQVPLLELTLPQLDLIPKSRPLSGRDFHCPQKMWMSKRFYFPCRKRSIKTS